MLRQPLRGARCTLARMEPGSSLPCATPVDTRALAHRFEDRFAPGTYRELGRTGLTVSGIGFGAWRVDDEREPHLRALQLALSSGINLVETAANAADGGSERAIGRVLQELSARGALRREEIVVVTKAGYVQGRALSRASEREAAGTPLPDVVKLADGCWHCLHPTFLGDQIRRSCKRLGLAAVDVLLLHDPEALLIEAAQREPERLPELRLELDRRLREAFAFLEGQCDAGRIRWYGISSASLSDPPDAPEALTLQHVLSLAQDAADQVGRPRDAHRFAVAGLPVNLLEMGAARHRGADGRTSLQVALDAGVGVLAHRPLNAFVGGRVVRLADWPPRAEGVGLDEAAAVVLELEAVFERDIGPGLEQGAGAPELFRWGTELVPNAGRFRDALHWRQVETELVRPHLEHALGHVGLHLVGKVRNDWSAWAPRYREAMERLLGTVADLFRQRAQDESDVLKKELSGLPAGWSGRTFSQQAVGLVMSLPGVAAVVLGMREEAWVRDALGALQRPPPPGMPAAPSTPTMP
jgi:aryl-alcohol dehydrogenase-like predicted oxidoreductase